MIHREFEDDIELLRYGRFLAAYAGLLLLGAVIGSVVALVIAFEQPVVYQASATIAMVSDGSKPMTPAIARGIVLNQTLAAQVVHALQLDRAGWHPQDFLSRAVEIAPLAGTDLLRVSVTLPDAAQARDAANLLVSKAINLSQQLSHDGDVESSGTLKRQFDAASTRFDEAQRQLLNFEQRNDVDQLKADTKADLDTWKELTKIGVSIDGESAKLAALKRELAGPPHAAAGGGTPAIVPATPAGGDGTLAIAAEGRATSVQTLLAYDIALSEATLASLQQQRQSLQRVAVESARRRTDFYRRRMELGRLQTDRDIASRDYAAVAQQYDTVRARAAAGVPQLQLVDAPVTPDRPVRVARVQDATFGGVLGLFASLLCALALNSRRAKRIPTS